MKKIYAIELDSDLGILWLDEEFNPLDYIHENDRHHESEFYINLGKISAFETIEEFAPDLLTEKQYDKMLDSDPDHAEAFAKFLVPKLKKKYEK